MRPRPLSAVLHAQESKEHENNHRICQGLSEAAGRAFAKATAHVARPSSWLRAAGSLPHLSQRLPALCTVHLHLVWRCCC